MHSWELFVDTLDLFMYFVGCEWSVRTEELECIVNAYIERVGILSRGTM